METGLENQDLDTQFGNEAQLPLVAVWMVTYNHEDFITEAIESVMMQETSFPYILFIGEDFSTDNTREICINLKDKYPNKINLILNNCNLGPAKNALQIYKLCINSGAKYIALIEGDDYWTDKNKLQKQVSFLDQYPRYIGVSHNSIVKIENDKKMLFRPHWSSETATEISVETLSENAIPFHTSSFTFRRNVLMNFDFSIFTQLISGDIPLFFLAASCGPIKYFDETMSVYRINKYSISQSRKDNLDKSIKKYYMYKIIHEKIVPQANLSSLYIPLLRKIIQKSIKNKDSISIIKYLLETLINKDIVAKEKKSIMVGSLKYFVVSVIHKIRKKS